MKSFSVTFVCAVAFVALGNAADEKPDNYYHTFEGELVHMGDVIPSTKQISLKLRDDAEGVRQGVAAKDNMKIGKSMHDAKDDLPKLLKSLNGNKKNEKLEKFVPEVQKKVGKQASNFAAGKGSIQQVNEMNKWLQDNWGKNLPK